MVDIGRDDRAATSHLIADEFRGDGLRKRRTPGLSGMLLNATGRAVRKGLCFLPSLCFPDSHKFHLGGDDALAGIMQL